MKKEWQQLVFVVLTVLAVVIMVPDTASAAVMAEEEGFWACIFCAIGAGFVIGSGGLAALYAVFATPAGVAIVAACVAECKELYDAWVENN